LQCVAVCGSVLQCVAVCCSVLQCVAVCLLLGHKMDKIHEHAIVTKRLKNKLGSANPLDRYEFGSPKFFSKTIKF